MAGVGSRGQHCPHLLVLVFIGTQESDFRIPLVEGSLAVVVGYGLDAAEVGHVYAAGDDDGGDALLGCGLDTVRPRAETPSQISSASSVVVMSRQPAM